MSKQLPSHVAFIVDGNRRWATKHGRAAITGHRFVTDHTLNDIVFYCLKLGISYVTFWAFSTENWKRGDVFVKALFGLLKKAVNQNVEQYHKAGIRLNTIGDLSKIPSDLVKLIEGHKNQSKDNKNLTVTIALNYGGRDELLRAVKKLVKSKAYSPDTIDSLTESSFAGYLDTADMPDPDMIIRTGGEQRLSGFLPWQSQYSELYFTPILMPEFTVEEFDKALEEYAKRQRRFGA